MTESTFEEYLAGVQAEVVRRKDEAQAKGERYGVTGHTNPQKLEEMFGMFANNPHAEAVLQSMEDEREKEREEARRAPEESET